MGTIIAARRALRLRHPDVLGLREPLVASNGLLASTVLEASWGYSGSIQAVARMAQEITIVGKLQALVRATKLFAAETEERGSPLNADDLVPLMALALVTCHLDERVLVFEVFTLSSLASDLVISSGEEAYCLCTFQVAHAFLCEVDVDGLEG